MWQKFRVPTHFVLVLDTSHSVDVLGQSRGSVHSVRRGSNDVRSIGSDFCRRTSLAKLNSLPLEAPITKVTKIYYKQCMLLLSVF